MGTLTFEFPDFLIFSPNHCIKDIFRKGDRYILRSYWMKEHACLAVLLGTQMHLRFGYMKLDKNLLSLSTNSKASFSFLGESFFCTHKKKKMSLNIWIIIRLASGTLWLPEESTYQFWGNWLSFSSLAPYNRRGGKWN